jgi:hypothetical protein
MKYLLFTLTGVMCLACGNGGSSSDNGSGLDGVSVDTPVVNPDGHANGMPCKEAQDCKYGICNASEWLTNNQFKVCIKPCLKHEDCDEGQVCLYPTEEVCAIKCKSKADCPSEYAECSIGTGTFPYCHN